MKRLIFGLLVVGIAFGGSAFTNVKHSRLSPVFGQTSVGVYQQVDGSGECLGATELRCSYNVITPNSIPDRGTTGTYTPAEIQSYVTAGWLTPSSSNFTLYVQ